MYAEPAVLHGPFGWSRKLQSQQQGVLGARRACVHAFGSARSSNLTRIRCFSSHVAGSRSLEAAGRPLRWRLSGSCTAGRDPDRVSLLSTDELLHSSDAPLSVQQRADGAALPGACSAQHAPTGSKEHATSDSLAGSSSELHDSKFLVSAAELRAIVAAALDSSQSTAAAEVITAVTQRVSCKQQVRHARHAARHLHRSSNGQVSSSTPGSAAAERSVAALSPATALASALGTDLGHGVRGNQADAAARAAAFGCNSLAVSATSSFWQLLLEAASDSTLLLLMAAGGLSLGLAAATGKEGVDYIDGAAILASVAICVNVTAVTNYQKEAKFRQLNSLKENIPVRVIRGGAEVTVSCFDLLVGDVLLLESGDILPADGLLIQGDHIKVDESHLTGESDDVTKEPISSSSRLNLSSCVCMSGSKVLEGFGRLLVLAVGPNSQQGIIQQLVLSGGTAAADGTAPAAAAGAAAGAELPMLREATPLTSRLEDLANSIGGVGLAAAAAVLAVNAGLYTMELLAQGSSLFTGNSLEAYLGFFITSMTLLVVAVPEGLPLAVTLALAFSVQRMLTDNNLVRNLSSCETMAAATSICSDKTGTLTENNMAVMKLFIGGAMFNVRPSSSSASNAASGRVPAAAAAAAAADMSVAAAAVCSGSSTRSTSSILDTPDSSDMTAAGTDDDDEQQNGTATSSSTASCSSTNGGEERLLVSRAGSGAGTAAAGVGAGHWGPVAGRSSRAVGVPPAGFDYEGVPADALTRVSLSWDDGDQLEGVPLTPATYEEQYLLAMQQQQQQQQQEVRQRQQLTAAAAGGDDYDSLLGLDDDSVLMSCPLPDGSSLSLSSTASLFGGMDAVSPSCMSEQVKQLLADSISVNSTASIRLVPQQQQQLAGNGQALSSATGSGGSGNFAEVSSGRQLDRSGNRTECALLEFGGRLAGRLLPGAGSRQQRQQVLQVFPFSSSRKRMSTLVAQGPPVATPGTGTAVQPARLYVKGAAELLLDSCRLQVGLTGALLPLPPEQRTALKARCGRGGLRVLALAYKDILLHPADPDQPARSSSSSSSGWQMLRDDDDQCDLVLVALLGLEDPVRAAVPGAILDCQRAGIAVRMITGDNAATAAAIAASCGIIQPELAAGVEHQAAQRSIDGISSSQHTMYLQQLLQQLTQPPALTLRSSSSSKGAERGKPNFIARLLLDIWGSAGGADPAAGAALIESVEPHPALAVLEGPQFRALVLNADGSTNLGAFLALWPHLRVMARCTPADKYILVQAVKALRSRGILSETIAVTGDGTNDAPALNAADVGFAMAAGTSIAKDASDILLLDNNFRSIVSAVKWGRNVYGCVTKFLQFQLTANVVALLTAAGGALALRSSPLSAVQMLWVNLIMDSLASLALATEAPTDDSLDEPPRVRDGPIITPTVAKSIVGQAGLQLGVMVALLGPLGDALVAAGADTAASSLDTSDHSCQYTLVFNSFVLMQLFNQVNSRKIHDEPDVLEGLGHQKLFLVILGLEAALQVAIVQAGGRAFSTVPLSIMQWAVCLGFGGLTLLLRQLLRAIPTEPPSAGPGNWEASTSRGRWPQSMRSATAVETGCNS